ncbi:sigma 54-interacting response regulator [Pedobacter duraquae]|uniref:Response regulator receiver domain-containing protein n=1 Tax=Pedobacter duraquae TaxID=425511 RepID=A0A4R6IPR3_9SPHI|nr:sigma 54-interacting response regulator [Pedobacter duraquae]TDO24304.1 response regulator receiver domain-containing protein [Pedobacter duraquae]
MIKEKILIVEDEFIVANDLRIMLEKSGYKVCGIAPSVPKALELIKTKAPNWILLDIFLQGDKTGIDLAGQLTEMDIPFIYISANTNQGILEAAKATLPYGFLVKPFREKDLMVMLDIAQYRHAQKQKYTNNTEPGLQQQLEHIFSKNEALAEKIKQAGSVLNAVLPFDFLWISRIQPKTSTRDLYIQRVNSNSFRTYTADQLCSELLVSSRDFKVWNTNATPNAGKPIFNGYDFRKLRMESNWIKATSDHFKLESALITELKLNDETFQLIFFSHAPEMYTRVHSDMSGRFESSLKFMIEQSIYGKDLSTAVQIQESPSIQPAKIAVLGDFNGIIGNSRLLHTVFEKITLVAPDDTSVLILGESGTGKEKIALTIHKLSPRASKPLITVNCAALPLSLIESELFGHEKGAFTGANEKRIGKFEQADGGSIFLDEIGELPLEAQVKLLRVLQEKEIERLGGNLTKKINVRIITATNRNLEKEVAEGRFRLDLYYRLNVFPIELPALRQRKEDIEVLVHHFLDKYSKKNSRAVTGISAEALASLQAYDWPGNIRELEHLIERSMLMANGTEITEIDLPTPSTSAFAEVGDNFKAKTMEEMERDHIMRVLKMCNGKVYGPGGAAEVLNIPSTTLNSKIKKLGIRYEFVK